MTSPFQSPSRSSMAFLCNTTLLELASPSIEVNDERRRRLRAFCKPNCVGVDWTSTFSGSPSEDVIGDDEASVVEVGEES